MSTSKVWYSVRSGTGESSARQVIKSSAEDVMQVMVDEDDRGGSTGELSSLTTAGLPAYPEDGCEAQHDLACCYRFFFIQDSSDEEGHTFGKVSACIPSTERLRSCMCSCTDLFSVSDASRAGVCASDNTLC